MKKRMLYMFIILQLLLIITNVCNIENMLFNIELLDIFKLFITVYSLLCIFFISKISRNTKIVFFSLLLVLSSLLVFEANSLYKIIKYFYYASSYTFLISYYKDNNLLKTNAKDSI